MKEQVTNQIVIDIAENLIQEYAPQEISIFRAQSKIFLNNPQAILKTSVNKEQITGSGTEVELVLLSPLLMAALQEVIKYLIEETKKALASESAALIHDYIKSLFKKLSPAQEGEDKDKETVKEKPTQSLHSEKVVKGPSNTRKTNKLTPSQIKKIHDIVYDQLIKGKMTSARAGLLANAVVGEFYTS